MRLLIVGNLEGHISAAGKIALQKGAKVSHVEDLETALGALRNGKGADLIFVDVKLPIEHFMKSLEAERIVVPVVVCGLGRKDETPSAVKAIKAGAKDYIPLPPDADLIAAVLAAVAEEQSGVIGTDPAMRNVLAMADKIAPSEATIMITGESGTGKEVMSRYIHAKSKRKEGSFIAINCAAIPENLLESELFGHEKGAFTGAVARRIGKFEEANGGTLLLDEISEMPLQLQSKLLRAIQERVVQRVGSNDLVKVDVRILATSNRDLMAFVKAGGFREDLYYRLNVVSLRLPSLRERKTDIVPLAQFFADKYADQNGMPKKKLSLDAQGKVARYDWPGNVRELENTMHRAILISGADELEPDAIMTGESDAQPEAASNAAPNMKLEDIEKAHILNTLDHCLGNRTQAASILGISIRTLRNKLQQYGAD